jgi:hypothetical protein
VAPRVTKLSSRKFPKVYTKSGFQIVGEFLASFLINADPMAFLISLAYSSIYIGAYSALLYKGYGKIFASLLAFVWPVTALVFLSRKLFLFISV